MATKTAEELATLKEKQDIQNPLYRLAANAQLNDWLKGYSIHNVTGRIVSVVDKDDNVVDYIEMTGGECCPDMSCCGSPIWDLSLRQAFVKAHNESNTELMDLILMTGLAGITQGIGDDIYIAGNIPDTELH